MIKEYLEHGNRKIKFLCQSEDIYVPKEDVAPKS